MQTRPKTQRCLEDRELNQARSKPDTGNTPVRTACIFVHHYNSTQYCNTDSFHLCSADCIKVKIWATLTNVLLVKIVQINCEKVAYVIFHEL